MDYHFWAGTAAVDITPTRQELDDFTQRQFSAKSLFAGGAAQPLTAKALATSDGERKLLVITADLLYTPLWMTDVIRGRLSEQFGLPRDAMAICTSQTHASPVPRDKDNAYTRRLIEEFVKVGAAALSNLRPAKIGAARGWLPSLCFNSDLNITASTPLEVCPDPERHAGGCMFVREHELGRSTGRPVDYEVGVIRVDDLDDHPVAVLFHYNCHPATVIEGAQMHGDWAGFAMEKIEAAAPGATAMFLQGCLGDSHPRYFFTDIERARENGLELADEVLRILPDIATTGEVSIGCTGEYFPVTFDAYPTDRLERLLGHFKDFLNEIDKEPNASWVGAGADTINLPPRATPEGRRNMVTPLVSYCEDKLALRRAGAPEEMKPLDTDIQIFRWNDIALCLNGFEMYFQTGLEIKRLSPLRYTFPVGNSNTLVGYIAPPDQFEFGGYPVVTNPMYAGFPGMRSAQNHVRIIERFNRLFDAILAK